MHMQSGLLITSDFFAHPKTGLFVIRRAALGSKHVTRVRAGRELITGFGGECNLLADAK